MVCIATTIKTSYKRWDLFRTKIRKDKEAYYNITKVKLELSPSYVISAFMWGILKDKYNIDLTFSGINTPFLAFIRIDDTIFYDIKKFSIDFYENNSVDRPRGVSGICNRIIEQYLRMDMREAIAKIILWEKSMKGGTP